MTTALGGASKVGVLQMGPARVAVTLSVLREVLPCPEHLEPLPATRSGLLGVTNVRGAVVPVLDLRLLLGWPAERAGGQIVAVVSLNDRVIGLLCDEVLGVTRLEDTTLQPLSDAEGELLFSHSFERPEDGLIVSLLDIEHLLTLPGVPVAHAPVATGSGPASGPAAGPEETSLHAADEAAAELVVIRCGPIRFGLDVASVHALLPKVELATSPLVGPLCVGVTDYADRSIPAAHLLRLVGLADGGDPTVNGGLILRYRVASGPGYVALLLSEVIEIVRVTDAQLLPLPAVLASVAGWFHGLVALPDIGDVLVLDAQRLADEPTLATLAALNTGPGTSALLPPGPRSGETLSDPGDPDPAAAGSISTRPASNGPASNGPASNGPATTGIRYLTYSAGHEVATPLMQVTEIITYPEAWTPIRRPETALLGVFTHHGAVVPLVCLSSLLGGEPASEDPDDPERRVVIVTVPDGTVGFIVPMLRAIEVSTWEEVVPPSDAPSGFLSPVEAAAVSHVVRVGSEGSDRNLRTLDLAAVAAALTATPEPAYSF